MPIRLSELAAKSRTIEVDFEGESIRVTYTPAKLTMATQARIQEAMKLPADQSNGELAAVLTDAVTGWDVLGDDGAQLPVTGETVRALPLRFVGALALALFNDMGPNARPARS